MSKSQEPPDDYQEAQRRQARRLLPAASDGRQLPAAATHQRPPAPGSTILRPRRKLVSAACDHCRKIKTKCSGERPTCHKCAQLQLPCHYPTQPGESRAGALRRKFGELNNEATASERLLDMLRTLPEDEAHDILHRIRTGVDATTVYNQLTAGDALIQLAVAPETRFRYELPYHSTLPPELTQSNAYLDSLIWEATSLYAGRPHEPTKSSGSSVSASSSPRSSNIPEPYDSTYLKPFHASHVVEPLLTDVKPSKWTSVCQDDTFMRHLLESLFHCEYSFTSAFQKTYFLEDMAAMSRNFCSSLLVNVVLAYACVCSSKTPLRAEYWNPQALVYRFLAEAKRLWELEAHRARLTTIQAGVILNVFHNLCGLDEIGQAYRINSYALANKMGLFDAPIQDADDRMRRGKIYTAWALYSWEALVGFSFMIPPVLEKPPVDPLPDPDQDPHFYGEVWFRYPFSPKLSPLHFGHLFRAKCEFRTIMQRFCTAAYTQGIEVSIDVAYELCEQLKYWCNHLPGPLQAKRAVLPAHLQLHTYLHQLLLAIYQPLSESITDLQPQPKEIIAEAEKNLQTLIRLYYLRHGFEAMDLFIVIPLIYSAFQCLEAINDKTTPAELEYMRSTLILAANGLYNQRRNHYLSQALYRVIKDRMRPEESTLLKHCMNVDEDDEGEAHELRQAVRSYWPVSVVKKKEDLDSRVLANLVGGLSVDVDQAEEGEASRRSPKADEGQKPKDESVSA